MRRNSIPAPLLQLPLGVTGRKKASFSEHSLPFFNVLFYPIPLKHISRHGSFIPSLFKLRFTCSSNQHVPRPWSPSLVTTLIRVSLLQRAAVLPINNSVLFLFLIGMVITGFPYSLSHLKTHHIHTENTAVHSLFLLKMFYDQLNDIFNDPLITTPFHQLTTFIWFYPFAYYSFWTPATLFLTQR